MVTLKFVLRLAKIRKTGLAPLCLRITKNRKQCYLTIAYIKPSLWNTNKEIVKKEHPNSVQFNNKLYAMRSRTQGIVMEYDVSQKHYSAKIIKEALTNQNSNNFISYANNWVCDRYERQVITFSSKIKYNGVVKKLSKYCCGELRIDKFTPEFIRDYQKHLVKVHKNSQNTISSNMSCLRAICNSLIDDGKMKLENYPFRKIKLSYRDSNRGFLTYSEIDKFKKVKLKENSTLKKSQDIFLFCLETGFRIGDALNLQKTDVNNNVLNYFSQKTKQYEMMPLTKAAKTIVHSHMNFSDNTVRLVFKILDESKLTNSQSSLNEQKRKTALINKNLKIIAQRAKITSSISTHIARHSMATNALSKGLSYAEIQSLLGHSDVKTTQIYAKTHNQMKVEAMKKLERK